jgi:hypothetical protein
MLRVGLGRQPRIESEPPDQRLVLGSIELVRQPLSNQVGPRQDRDHPSRHREFDCGARLGVAHQHGEQLVVDRQRQHQQPSRYGSRQQLAQLRVDLQHVAFEQGYAKARGALGDGRQFGIIVAQRSRLGDAHHAKAGKTIDGHGEIDGEPAAHVIEAAQHHQPTTIGRGALGHATRAATTLGHGKVFRDIGHAHGDAHGMRPT